MNGILDISDKLTRSRYWRAVKRDTIPKDIGNSETGGERNFPATLVECCVAALVGEDSKTPVRIFPPESFTPSLRDDCDFVANGWRVEVKTKFGEQPPRERFTCHVHAKSAAQAWDYIVFAYFRGEKLGRCEETGVQDWGEPEGIYALGFLSREEWEQCRVFLKKGECWEKDPAFPVRNDCYAVLVEDLRPMSELLAGSPLAVGM